MFAFLFSYKRATMYPLSCVFLALLFFHPFRVAMWMNIDSLPPSLVSCTMCHVLS